MQMYTYFWCGVEIDDFIFKGINISNWQGYLVYHTYDLFYSYFTLYV